MLIESQSSPRSRRRLVESPTAAGEPIRKILERGSAAIAGAPIVLAALSLFNTA